MANRYPSSSNNNNIRLYLNFSMAGWANGSVANPHQVREAGSIPAPAKMNYYWGGKEWKQKRKAAN